MKVLLIRPPATYLNGSIPPQASIPVGLLSIGALLEHHNFSVELIDAQIAPSHPVFATENGAIQMGLSWDDLAARVRQSNADLVGISAMFSAQFDNTVICAALARAALPNAVIVLGGNHATVRPDDCFRMADAVNIVCIGEGEMTMLDIACALRDGQDMTAITGTAVKSGHEIRFNQHRDLIDNLDQLPVPAYHLLNLEDYFSLYRQGFSDRTTRDYPGSERAVSIITSRGCPFNCVFCSIHLHMGRKWRSHSVEYVRKQIEMLVSTYGIRHLHFEDDNISANQRRFKEILQMLLARGNSLTWDTPNGVRVDTLTKEIVELCRQSGCAYLIFGVESGNRRVLREVIDKELDLDSVTVAARWCHDAGLQTMAFYIMGFPGEQLHEIDDTIEFALGLFTNYAVIPHLFVATPLPGTRLEAIYKERGLLQRTLQPEDFALITQGTIVLETDTVGRKEIVSAMGRFKRRYKLLFIRSTLLFFLRNPQAIVNFIKETRRSARKLPLITAAYRVLEFRNSLK